MACFIQINLLEDSEIISEIRGNETILNESINSHRLIHKNSKECLLVNSNL